MSTRPHSSTTFCTSSSGTPGFVRSPANTSVSPAISDAVCSATSPSRSLIRTFAPFSERSSAVARPMPRAEPVTIATLSSRIAISGPPISRVEAGHHASDGANGASAADRDCKGAGAEPRLDRAVDEPGPAIGEVRTREDDPTLGPSHGGVMVLVPARAVDRPGPARELVGKPVVGGGVERLIPRQDRVQLRLHRGQVAGVAARGVDPEADHQL